MHPDQDERENKLQDKREDNKEVSSIVAIYRERDQHVRFV